MLFELIILFFSILLLLILSGFFSGSETALTATSAPDTVKTAVDGTTGAAAATGITADLSGWL